MGRAASLGGHIFCFDRAESWGELIAVVLLPLLGEVHWLRDSLGIRLVDPHTSLALRLMLQCRIPPE
jgi:hypothetical protein